MVFKYNQKQNSKSLTCLDLNIRTFKINISQKNLKQNICVKKTRNTSLIQIINYLNYGNNNNRIKIKNSTRPNYHEYDQRTTLCQKQQDGIKYLKEIAILSIQ
ncbi:unnamed protein product [Paramecium sonneborni]|uniref:Uncharacterized protein n=1 Tax=Paramecium sonneborni TaxID=65129 RepID=A0A8S1M7V6_9CILI|nr:unnamed protein product [Paramecium sonneborni]